MRTVRWLVAAGLLASATGCIEMNGLPNTSMGGYPSSGYYGQPSYNTGGGGLLSSLFNQPTPYQAAYPQPYYQPAPQYYPVPVAQPQPNYVPVPTAGTRPAWRNKDRNNNGVADWKERDRNGDGVPDYQQRRSNRAG